ncbi:DoxX family protein [Rhizobium tubonense]|uniref:Quinol oxidase n=1 Tax=Rhizobium tubonense TaxID=484088 RepID=A0A2W4CIZ5_9HYPH|nr:DoxX family protein [Rhizobium tubonense]PZM10575.1 quinol oxidase [Rhizobium tubonense]
MKNGKPFADVHATDVALLIGRLLLSLIFLHEGITLSLNFDGAVEAMAKLGIGVPLLLGTIALQLAAGASVAFGILTRIGALLLGLFCLSTALLFHTNFASQNELLHFEKDFAIAGGMFVLAVVGAGSLSFDRLMRRRRP